MVSLHNNRKLRHSPPSPSNTSPKLPTHSTLCSLPTQNQLHGFSVDFLFCFVLSVFLVHSDLHLCVYVSFFLFFCLMTFQYHPPTPRKAVEALDEGSYQQSCLNQTSTFLTLGSKSTIGGIKNEENSFHIKYWQHLRDTGIFKRDRYKNHQMS